MTGTRVCRRRRWPRINWLLVAVLAASVIGSAGIAGAQRRRRPRRRPRRNPIKVGQVAPDFELPTLKSVLANIKDGKVKKDRLKRVKLSGFRGKRPVCLIFTSCT